MEKIPSKRHSITLRMTVTVCSFLILFQAVVAVLIFFHFKREFKQTISAQQFTMLTVVTQNIDQKLSSSQKVIVDVSRLVTPAIVSDSDAAQRFLDNRPGTRSLFDNGLFLFSADGTIIAETPYLAGRRGRDITFRGFYKKTIATGQPVISEPYFSTHTPGAPAIMFTAPVRNREGKLIAILGGSLNLLNDNFLGELVHTRIAKTGYLYIVNRDRTMIMHPDRKRIMQDPEISGTNRLLDKAFQGFEGSGENVNSRGMRSLTSFKQFRTTDWIMGANYPLAEAYAPIYQFQRYLLIVMLFGTLFSVFAVRLMMGRFTSSLVRFAEHVRNMPAKQGADRLFTDYVSDEIGILARTFNQMVQHEDLKSEELVHTSTHDALTGLYNRAYFDSELGRLARGRQMPISVVVADIDGLKKCNDTHGHQAGDALIRGAAQLLLESFRSEDIVARIGGDEFAVLLPGVDAGMVQMALDRVRSAEAKAASAHGLYPLSVSLGHATSESAEGVLEAFKSADELMYLEKAARKQGTA